MSSIRTSKFLSLVLRHQPQLIGITLDDAGWVGVTDLLAACARHGTRISRDELDTVVRESDKQRFALSPDGARIRANQGHSVKVDLQLPSATPPAVLYHGTVEPALDGIREKGLVAGKRHHVHLSAEVKTATAVGKRRGAPVILTIRAADMVAAGHTFYRSANGVWLVETVPPRFIEFRPPKHERPPGGPGPSRSACVAIAKATLAALEARHYVNEAGEVVQLGELIDAACAGTVLHELGGAMRPRSDDPGAGTASAGDALRAATPRRERARIVVTNETTNAAVRRMAGRDHVACLNFASAHNPGGGFLNGATAQEESLARASALYPCLREQMDHYHRNRAHRSSMYLDLAIFSPDVPFVRDDAGAWLARPVCASVITCAAPNAKALRQHGRFDADAVEAALRRRAAFVLQIAAHHGVDRLVLGAWGAGAFGNDPEVVASAFREALVDYRDAFAEVVFAIMGGAGANLDAFTAAFRSMS